jgi:hypothetical protein
MKRSLLPAIAALLASSGPLLSQPAGNDLAACRRLSGATERLDCYDRLADGVAGRAPSRASSLPASLPAGRLTLGETFSADMLGVQVTFFESKAGPARRVRALPGVTGRDYLIEGCPVTAYTGRDNAIQAYSLRVGESCDVRLEWILPSAVASIRSQTVGSLADINGQPEITIPCLESCGNAADPYGTAVWPGPRANGFVDVEVGFTLGGQADYRAVDGLRERIVREQGASYLAGERYNCEARYQGAALAAFRTMAVDTITVGRGVWDRATARRNAQCRPARR